MHFTENFRQALQDYIFLIEKRYPEKSVLELVATRYALNHFERSALYRGLTGQKASEQRKQKLITIDQLNNRPLHIDLFNVLFTIAAYLRGYPVFLSNDGLVRDASESHGKGDWEVHLEKGLDMLKDFLYESKIREATLYIDNLLDYSLSVIEKIKDLHNLHDITIRIVKDPSPDHLIKAIIDGVVATSDSTIIDKSNLQIIDLPGFIIKKSFHKEIANVLDL